MNIPERYQVTGKRIDNDKTIQGYPIRYSNERYAIRVVEGEHYSELGEWFVIPETVEPVAVKVVRKFVPADGIDVFEDYYSLHCPNCDAMLGDTTEDYRWEKHKHCPPCGQRLDWSEHHDK